MAGEWIKLEAATLTKPEVLRMARLLKCDPDLILGKLIRLWGWFDSNSVDGRVDGVASQDIDVLVKLEGFSGAMHSVGWLHFNDDEEYVVLPNFERHNGETAKKRALKNKRQSKWRQNRDENVDANESTQASTYASTTASTREEKRRNKSTTDFPPEFEQTWKKYPTRSGGNPKAKALKAWNARRQEGHTAEEIDAGVIRYSRWITSTGKAGTEFVKQASTFFGPDKHFLEPWGITSPADEDEIPDWMRNYV